MSDKNKYDLMDQELFPNNSDYIFKENPRVGTPRVSRAAKSDEDIIEAVTNVMLNTPEAKSE